MHPYINLKERTDNLELADGALIGDMAEGAAGDQRGGSMDTEQDLLLQREQAETRVISSPGSSREVNLAATAPAPRAKKPGYFSENGCLMELSRQERQRIEQETKKRFKPGETWLNDSCSINAPTCTCILLCRSMQYMCMT